MSSYLELGRLITNTQIIVGANPRCEYIVYHNYAFIIPS